MILLHLPILDLLQFSRTCHKFRLLSVDCLLHRERRKQAVLDLEHRLLWRTSRAAISPPNAWIRLTKTHVLSRSISRSLAKISLGHRLESRPTVQMLISRAVLPSYSSLISPSLVDSQRAVSRKRLENELCRKLRRRPSRNSLVSLNIIPEDSMKTNISPVIAEKRRQILRETLKDGLRAWVQNRALTAQRRRASELDEVERSTVKLLVRRLTARKATADLESRADRLAMEKKQAQTRWGRALQEQRSRDRCRAGCPQPARANVLALRRVFEGAKSDVS